MRTIINIFDIGNLILGENSYGKNKPIIVTSHNGIKQGVIEFVHHDDGHSLYLWYDEGKFPNEFDTTGDIGHRERKRLKIIGVDEI